MHLAMNPFDMKRTYWLVVLGLMLLVSPRVSAATEAQMRLHFVGANAVQNHREALVLRDIAKIAEGAPVFQLITRQLAGKWSAGLGIAPSPATNQLAGAIAEILRAEIYFELTSPNTAAWRLAARLPEDKAKSVQTTLQDFARAAKAVVEAKVDATGSWRFTPLKTKQATHVSYQRGWLVIDSTGDAQPSNWRQHLMQHGKLSLPTGPIGALSVKSTLLKTWVPRLQNGAPFDVSLMTKVRKGTLRTEGTIDFQHPVKPDLEPFQLPTNTLRDPMISFTAARGISGLLARQPELRQWRLPKYPNQLIAWTESDRPVYTTMAMPLKGADGWFKKQIPRFEESLGLIVESKGMGTIKYMTNYHAAVWRGLPLIAPYVSPNPRDPDWLFAASFPGFLPKGAITNAPPEQLLSQIRNRDDLIYYHWEVTEPRVQQLQLISSLAGVLMMKRMPLAGNPMPVWIKAMQDRLGNTITELTRASDRQWRFVRSSSVGLTAAELAVLGQLLTPSKPMAGMPLPPGLNRK